MRGRGEKQERTTRSFDHQLRVLPHESNRLQRPTHLDAGYVEHAHVPMRPTQPYDASIPKHRSTASELKRASEASERNKKAARSRLAASRPRRKPERATCIPP